MKLPRRRGQRAGARPAPSPRVMARPFHEVRPAARPARSGGPGMGVAVISIFALAALVMVALLGLPPSTAQPFASGDAGSSPTHPTARGSASGGPARSPTGNAVRPSSSPTANSSAPLKPPASPRQTPRPDPDAAPQNAAEFDLEGQVIVIGFPFKERARYDYRDTFGARREGEAEDYNHARVRDGDRLLRAHDGTDVYAPAGTPVVAPFDGVVIEPSERWRPWIAERYGRTAAIVSGEPATEGYAALLSHLEALYVVPGQVVHRGEVIGTVGDSGNAEGGRPHLHFELRAPFLLTWSQVGEERPIDAFNPYPSLRAADPRRDR